MGKTPLFMLLPLFWSIVACQSDHTEAVPSVVPPPYRLIAYANDLMPREHAQMLTHINFAFANVVDGELRIESKDSLRLSRMHRLKRYNPHLQILISAGGWTWSGGFSDAALSDSSRHRFAKSAVRVLQHFQLDGIDIDWEYPGQAGNDNPHRPEDKQNFSLLLQCMRQYLDAHRIAQKRAQPYLLTVATGANQSFLDHTEMDKAAAYLDFVNLMTYDYYGPWTLTTGHHTNLSPSGQADRDSKKAVAEYRAAGVPNEKLVLGVAFYGRGWEGVDTARHGLFQPYSGRTFSVPYQDIDSVMRGATHYWDSLAEAPYLWNADTRTFLSYEDSVSLRYKADYVKREKLGGIMFWHYRHDTAGVLLSRLYERLQIVAKAQNQDQ